MFSLGGLLTQGGVTAGAEALGGLVADADAGWREGPHERLRVGVDGYEFETGDVGTNHAIDRVAAAAADSDDLDGRKGLHAELGARARTGFLTSTSGISQAGDFAAAARFLSHDPHRPFSGNPGRLTRIPGARSDPACPMQTKRP